MRGAWWACEGAGGCGNAEAKRGGCGSRAHDAVVRDGPPDAFEIRRENAKSSRAARGAGVLRVLYHTARCVLHEGRRKEKGRSVRMHPMC